MKINDTTALSDDVTFIDPVPPQDQTEQQDPVFNRMGRDQNAKFIEQKVDEDRPVGSTNGEYRNDDENAEENPPSEEILHDVTEDNESIIE